MPHKFCVEENEAMATKYCPMSLGRTAQYTADGSTIEPFTPGFCWGSKCMAWRFVETNIKDESGDFTISSGDTHGVCGLAGPSKAYK